MKLRFSRAFAVLGLLVASAPSAARADDLAKIPVASYVLVTSVSNGQQCSTPGARDLLAVRDLIRTKLGNAYSVQDYLTPPPDILADAAGRLTKNRAPGFVVISTLCKTGDVGSISVAAYALKRTPDGSVSIESGNSFSGSLDALEASDWSNPFGQHALISNVAFLPITNDTVGVVNSRLLRNLPLTVIATPAPVPGPTLSPGSVGPPTTALAACQASGLNMLVAGRTVSATQNLDVTRAIVAGASLGFSQPKGWAALYKIIGSGLSLIGIPNVAQASADVFVCTKDDLYQIGGLDHHITGYARSPAIGVNSLVQQNVLDTATLDLANQLDCIIQNQTKGKTPDTIAASDWCLHVYLPKLPKMARVNRPLGITNTSQSQ
jgi:hypothetical protein